VGNRILEIIEIKWEGPFHLQDVRKMKGLKDYGVYQVYGPHAVYGSDSLLYIGKANKSTFAERFNKHETWIDDEQAEVSVYVGRLGGGKQLSDTEWEKQINQAEALLLYFTTPLYNKKEEQVDYQKQTVVLNFYKCNKLPLVVSNLWKNSSIWVHEWEEYSWKKNSNRRKVNTKKRK
jgi:hypothetical protein